MLKQKHHKFEATMGNKARLCLKSKTKVSNRGLGMMAQACEPSIKKNQPGGWFTPTTWEVKAEAAAVHTQSVLHRQLKTNLGNVEPYSKAQKGRTKEKKERKGREVWAAMEAQWQEYLLLVKHEDLNPSPSIHIKSWVWQTVCWLPVWLQVQ